MHFEEVDAIACSENRSANKEASRAYQLFNVLSDKYKEESKLLITCTTNYYEKCASEFRSRYILVEVDQIAGKERIETFKKLLIDEGIKKLEKQLSNFSLEFETQFKKLKTSINEKLKILRYEDSEEKILKLFDEVKILLGHIIILIRDDEKRNNFHKSLDHIDSSKNQYLTKKSSIVLLDEIESLLTNVDEYQIYSFAAS